MSPVIRISDKIYKRLEAHVSGFNDTPSLVISKALDALEGVEPQPAKPTTMELSLSPRSLEIIYFPNTEEAFKQVFLESKTAYIKLHYMNGTSIIKEWNASRFTDDSSVLQNLQSGYLRGWKDKGIYKAEVAIDRSELSEKADHIMNENIQIDELVLIIKVSQLYRPTMTELELYEITRGVWDLGGSKMQNIEYVFSVFGGIIKEIYKVNTWHPALSTPYQTRTEMDITLDGAISTDGRWEFLGEIAKPQIRNKYLGQSVAFLFKQGAANPINYQNC